MSANKCYSIPKYQGRFVPVLATHDLNVANKNITTVIVAIHGLNENVAGAYEGIVNSVHSYNIEKKVDPNSVLVVVPWFHRNSINSAEWSPLCASLDASFPSFAWSTNSSWVSGGDSMRDQSVSVGLNTTFVSSFGVLDDLHTTLTTSGMYPSLRRVNYVGFSAGGQMINRYAWASNVGKHKPHTDLSSKFIIPDPVTDKSTHTGVSVRFIVSDASSYVYFDNFRPASSCRVGYDTGVHHNCTTFIEPTTTSCNQYNVWKYGTVVLPSPEDGVSYLQTLSGDADKVAAQTQQYRHKDVRYVFGAWDSCNCKSDGYANPDHCTPPTYTVGSNANRGARHGRGDKVVRALSDVVSGADSTADTDSADTTTNTDSTSTTMQPMCLNPTTNDILSANPTGTYTSCCDTFPDAFNNDLSTSCGSSLQGSNRLQRGLNYMYYLQHYYNYNKRSAHRYTRGVDTLGSGVSGVDGVGGVGVFSPVYEVIPELQHDMPAFFNTKVVQQWMLDPVVDTPHLLHDSTLYGDVVHTIEIVVVVLLFALYLYVIRRYMQGDCGGRKVRNNRNSTTNTSAVDEEQLNTEPSEVTHLLYK